ncbi:MAG: methyltransferase [Agarilytica sp.]
MRYTLILTALFCMSCDQNQPDLPKPPPSALTSTTPTPLIQKPHVAPPTPSLSAILLARDEDDRSRDTARHPKETLDFFRIKPGMTVAEALPGKGWYSKILMSYLGENGVLVGIDYEFSMWPHFPFVDDSFMTKRKHWAHDWPIETTLWNIDEPSQVEAYTFATVPEALDAKFDRVLFIRALHNLSRFNDKGAFMENALKTTFRMLKPGGLVGVVQHQSPETAEDSWADGTNGYLKKSAVIKFFSTSGFELISESSINENPKDQPTSKDAVWRLPPTLRTNKDNEKYKGDYEEIGESNRMTLLFKKPYNE